MHANTAVKGSAPTDRAEPARPALLWINHFAVTSGEGGGTRHIELSRELVRLKCDVPVDVSIDTM